MSRKKKPAPDLMVFPSEAWITVGVDGYQQVYTSLKAAREAMAKHYFDAVGSHLWWHFSDTPPDPAKYRRRIIGPFDLSKCRVREMTVDLAGAVQVTE